MNALQVTTSGFAELAAACTQEAANSTAAGNPLVHSSFRATAAAVYVANAEVTAVGEQISGRLTWSGEMAIAARAAYDAQDENAAARLRAVGFSVPEA